ANFVRDGFKNLGFTVLEGRTGIVPVIIGDDDLAFRMWKILYDKGVFVNVFVSPGVPEGRQMMRTSYMATHNEEQLSQLLDIFKETGKELGLI
ncbi:MAG: aminotransferase class I/II-fold pyridoxal phosphate-dependent enzyme, partial [Bacteroidetes bacterium]|nr:aminotransferase class I/II-fold pyridoxal phosphate-dependent enzyme [Bacteroidota bacterium]